MAADALADRGACDCDAENVVDDDDDDDDENDEDEDEDDARAAVTAGAPADCAAEATGAASRAIRAPDSGSFFSAMTSFLGRPTAGAEANTRALVTLWARLTDEVNVLAALTAPRPCGSSSCKKLCPDCKT